MYFTIRSDLTLQGKYSVSCSPGLADTIDYFAKGLFWPQVLNTFNLWVAQLANEIQSPDLWETVPDDAQLIKLAADQENQPFSPSEQLHVKKALVEINSYLSKTHNLTESHLKAIESRLSYLEESATRMGRKDWLHVSIGVLSNIAVALALSGNDTRDLFQFAGQVLKQLFGTVLYLAGPH